jgi:hypothetical protein
MLKGPIAVSQQDMQSRGEGIVDECQIGLTVTVEITRNYHAGV